MKAALLLGLFFAQSAFALELPPQELSLINGCTLEKYECLTLNDSWGDAVDILGDKEILQQLATHVGEDVLVQGDMSSESTFEVTSFQVVGE
jgi:hypothetical protein